MRFRFASLFFVVLLLSACGFGLDKLELPAERPKGSIKGKVLGGLYSGGTLSAYSLDDARARKFLARTDISENGEFELNISAKSQLVILEASEGTYLNPEKTTEDSIENTDLTITNVINYQSPEAHESLVTPFSHLSTGLLLYAKQVQGDVSITDLENAKTKISNLYQLDLNNTTLGLQQDEITRKIAISGDEKHGLLINALYAVVSSERAGKQDPLAEQFSLGTLTDLMYEDIRADGLLNGTALHDDGKEEKDLAFGEKSVSFNFYRSDMAQAIRKAIDSSALTEFIDEKEQQSYLYSVAGMQNELLVKADSEELKNAVPLIKLFTFVSDVQSESFSVEVLIDNVIDVSSVSLFVDDSLIETLENPEITLFTLDTTTFTDGWHKLKITASDGFGNVGEKEIPILFDNSAPVLTVTSSQLTSKKRFIITGEMNEEHSSVQTISVNGDSNVELNDNQTWSYAANLESGTNHFVIGIQDEAGNYNEFNTSVVLDDIAPEIKYFDAIETNFSNNDGSTYKATLELENQSPLYLESNTLSLNGMSTQEENLNQTNIPFFKFTVSDGELGGDESNPDELILEYQYAINETVVVPWQQLDLNLDNNEILLPLVSETLSSSWYKVSADDLNKIDVRATDKAGNAVTQSITFMSQIYVPNISVIVNDELDSLSDGSFETRNAYLDTEVVGANYSIFNDTGRPFRIRLSDSGATHTLRQDYEVLQRENRVQLRASEEWRKSDITDLEAECPSLVGNWREITKVLNYIETEDGLGRETLSPTVTDLHEEMVTDDIPEPPAPSEWVNFTTNDTAVFHQLRSVIDDTLEYDMDYVEAGRVNKFIAQRHPGLLSGWKLTTVDSEIPIFCPDVHSMQTRLVYSYLPVEGFPRNVVNDESISKDFQTSGFRIYDEDKNEIFPQDGWYEIPENHRVDIQKVVKTPSLTLNNDQVVVKPDEVTDYDPHTLDKGFYWEINRTLLVETQFNPDNILTPEDNIRRQEFTPDVKIVNFIRNE